MRFKSEAERDQHPLASLIPKSLWENANYFNHQLTSEQVELMEASVEDLISIILKKELDARDMGTNLLAIVFAHPELNATDLMAISRYLGITNPIILFTLAVRANNTPWLREILKDDPALSLPVVSHYPLLIEAVRQGNVGMVEIILKCVSNNTHETVVFMNYMVFKEAAKIGNFEMMVCLMARALSKNQIEEMIAANHFDVFKTAMLHERLDIMEHLLNVYPLEKAREMITACHDWAVQHNHTEALNLLQTLPVVRLPLRGIISSVLKGVSTKDIQLVQDKLQHCDKLGEAITAEIQYLLGLNSKGKKLCAIVESILRLPDDLSFTSLRQQFLDDENPLPQALALGLENSVLDDAAQLAEIDELVRHSPGSGPGIII